MPTTLNDREMNVPEFADQHERVHLLSHLALCGLRKTHLVSVITSALLRIWHKGCCVQRNHLPEGYTSMAA